MAGWELSTARMTRSSNVKWRSRFLASIPDTEPELLERFIREARVAAGIRHPHVCPVYDAGRVEGVPYLTMALIDGGSLEDRVQAGGTPPRDAVEIVRKLAAGLETVHRAGMIHRDIKPSNVLIDQAGEPLLADFGLARPLSGMDVIQTAGPFSGTPAYMAPEQIADGSVDARTDVYSLAVLLHRLVTGELAHCEDAGARSGSDGSGRSSALECTVLGNGLRIGVDLSASVERRSGCPAGLGP